MPRLADEDGQVIPCETCFGRIGRKDTRDEQCTPPTGRGSRCNNCATRHRECKPIPRAAHGAVGRMLEMRRQLWMGRITEQDFEYWHADARRVISDEKSASQAAEPEAAAAAVQGPPARQVASTQQQSPAGRSSVVLENAPQRAFADPIDEEMDIDGMGVAATLHAILRTLIKIDRRMESLETRIG